MKYYTKEKHEVLKEFDVTIESGLTDASSARNRENLARINLKKKKQIRIGEFFFVVLRSQSSLY